MNIRWPRSFTIEPHDYWPDYQAMGDCLICGHLRDDPIHTNTGKKMVENQHRKITGYRDLSEVEIGAMNDCKSAAIQIGILCDKVATMDSVDQRWLAIAKTDLQKGFMSLIRSIARPETF